MAADQQSISAAAKKLGYSQSTVTSQIQQLESELGVKLFDRINKKIRPTKEGLELLHYARSILDTVHQAERAIRGNTEVDGLLRMALADSICSEFFPDLLDRYHRLYPKSDIRLFTCDTTEMNRMLSHNEVDLIYTMDHRIARQDLVRAFEKEEPVSVVAAADSPLRDKDLTLEDLTRNEFILTESGMSYRDEFDQLLALSDLHVKPYLEVGNVDVIVQLVARGCGLSLLPEYAVKQQIRAGRLVRLKVEGLKLSVWRQLFYHHEKVVTPEMKAMISLIRSRSAENT